MAHRLYALGRAFELHYSVRDRSATAFLRDLDAFPWRKKVHLHVTSENSRLDPDAILNEYADGSHLYTCGPERYLTAVLAAAATHGWPEAAVHTEYFSTPEVAEYENHPFTIRLAASNRKIVVPADKSAAIALIEHGDSHRHEMRGRALRRLQTQSSRRRRRAPGFRALLGATTREHDHLPVARPGIRRRDRNRCLMRGSPPTLVSRRSRQSGSARRKSATGSTVLTEGFSRTSQHLFGLEMPRWRGLFGLAKAATLLSACGNPDANGHGEALAGGITPRSAGVPD